MQCSQKKKNKQTKTLTWSWVGADKMRNLETPVCARNPIKISRADWAPAQSMNLMNRENGKSDLRILQGGCLCCRRGFLLDAGDESRQARQAWCAVLKARVRSFHWISRVKLRSYSRILSNTVTRIDNYIYFLFSIFLIWQWELLPTYI